MSSDTSTHSAKAQEPIAQFDGPPPEEHPLYHEVVTLADILGKSLAFTDFHSSHLVGYKDMIHLNKLSDELRAFWGNAKCQGGIYGVGVGTGKTPKDTSPRVVLYVRDPVRFKRIFRNYTRLRLPGATHEHIIQFEQVGLFRASGRGYTRPAHCGCSVGHAYQLGGSIGCLVNRVGEADGQVYLLSAAHVLAANNASRPGEPIYQPALRYGGDRNNPSHRIGELVSYTPLINGGTGDVAIAKPDSRVHVTPVIWDQRHSLSQGATRISQVGDRVPVGGRTPRLRESIILHYGAGSDNAGSVVGTVYSIRTTVIVRFPGFNWVTLRNMAIAELNITEGDSGAGLYTPDNYLVGIVCARGPGSEKQKQKPVAVFTPYPTAASALGVSIAGV